MADGCWWEKEKKFLTLIILLESAASINGDNYFKVHKINSESKKKKNW